MRRLRTKIYLAVAVTVACAGLTTPLVASAHAENASEAMHMSEDEHAATGHGKLAENKLRICKQRQKNITAIMKRRAEHGARQLEVFNKIAERTKAFYVEKGKTLATYDTLVSDVNAKKAAAEASLVKLKDASTSFTCDGDNPKGVADSFKAALESKNQTFKEYKTAVKNLIVGVKSVQGATSSGTTEKENQ